MKAIIPAAGMGSRFLPITKAQPKEMLPVVDKPVIQYVVEEAVAAGIDDIVIVTGRGKRAIEDHFDRSIELELALVDRDEYKYLQQLEDLLSKVDIFYIRQSSQRGLGHAVWCARKHIGNEPFAVLLGDDIIISKTPCIKQLMTASEQYDSSVIGVQKILRKNIPRYGIIDGEKMSSRIYKVKNLVEKPPIEKAPSDIGIIGRYIFKPDIFSYIEKTKPGINNEVQLTDSLKLYNKHHDIYAHLIEGKRYDVGNKVDWLQTNIELQKILEK
ncbi:MAG: UTP--glucose-1-phosphate uridylyltransferase GalU [Thermoplasmata archaeon]